MKQATRDPAVVAIEQWQRAWNKFCAFLNIQGVEIDKKREATLDRQVKIAERQINKTVPTTMDGVVAVLRWHEQELRVFNHFDGPGAADPIPAVLKGLKKINQRAAK